MSGLYEPVDPPAAAPVYVSAGLFEILAHTEGAVIEADAANQYVTTRNGCTYYTPAVAS